MEAILTYLRETPIFALFIIIAIGFMVGKINIKGFSFDVAAVIFVALLFGHYGIVVSPVLQTMGLVLFIFTVGLQAGPGFFDSFKSRGRKYVVLAFLLVLVSLVTAVVLKYAFGLPADILAGILCGALTSTPGLSVAIESTGSPLASIGYGIAYPFGVIGVILFVKLLPKLLRLNLKEVHEASSTKEHDHSIRYLAFRVANAPVFGKKLSEIRLRDMTGATVSRVQHGKDVVPPTPDTVLEEGDIIRAVGTPEALESVKLLVGPVVESSLSLSHGYHVVGLLVTNKAIVNQTLSQVRMEYGSNLLVTRVRRSGIDMSPSPHFTFRFGDKVTVACHDSDLEKLKGIFGNNAKVLSDTDFFPIALGVVLGILLGNVHMSIGHSFSVSLGLTGGVLIAALVLSNLGKTGPILWTMTGAANNLLRQLGLLLFLAGVGTSAGTSLVRTLSEAGISLLVVGAIITLVPMVTTVLLNAWLFRVNIFELFGVLTGGMTSTPGLAACESMAFDETPSVVYATVYPIAMVALLLAVKIVAAL